MGRAGREVGPRSRVASDPRSALGFWPWASEALSAESLSVAGCVRFCAVLLRSLWEKRLASDLTLGPPGTTQQGPVSRSSSLSWW